MATPSKGVFGNPPPQIGQEIDSLCSNTPQKKVWDWWLFKK